MKTTKLLACALLTLTMSGTASVAAAPVGAKVAVELGAVASDMNGYEIVEVRLTRAERRALRQERRAARRAARQAQQDTGSVDAPFGFLSDGVTPRTQPITRSDQRFIDNGNRLIAADSFFNENRR